VLQIKPAEVPPVTRYVIRDENRHYYSGHDPLTQLPGFTTRDILFAVKYGDIESIERMIKEYKKFCIDSDIPGTLFDTCEVLATYT